MTGVPTRRRRLVLIVVAAVLVLSGASVALWLGHRQVRVVVDPACPPLLTHTDDRTQDFADVVTWEGRTYVRAEHGPDLEPTEDVGVVTCLVGAMRNPEGWRLAPGPWPDGTATRLPEGTVLRRAGERGLAAVEADGPTLYCVQGARGVLTC